MGNNRKPTYGAAINMAKLIHTLCTQTRSVTLQDVLRILNVSERTARRYLRVLNEHLANANGEPLIRVARIEGVERWHLNEDVKREATPYQLASVFIGSVLMRFLEGTVIRDGLLDMLSHTEETASLLQKNTLGKKFHYTAFGMKRYEGFDDQIDTILRGLLSQRKLTFLYRSSRGEAEHTVSPYTFLMHKESLYLVAHTEVHGEIRTFSIEKMSEVRLGSESFNYPSDYSPQEMLGKSFGVFQGDTGKSIKVVVEFPEQLHEYVTSRRWISNQRFTRVRKGRFRMTVVVSDLFEVKHWVMGFGSGAKVIQPRRLAELLKSEFQAMAEAYRSRPGLPSGVPVPSAPPAPE